MISINWIKSHPTRAATIAGWYQQICSIGGMALSIPVVIKSLGNQDVGIWFSLQGLIAIFLLTDFGFSMAITRQVAHTYNLNLQAGHLSTDLIETSPGWDGVEHLYVASKKIFKRVAIGSLFLFILTYELILPWTSLLPHRTVETAVVWYLLAGSFSIIFQARLDQAFLDGLGYMYVTRFIAGSYQLGCGIFSIFALWFGFGLMGLASVLFVGSVLQLFVTRLSFKYIVSNNFNASNVHHQARPLIRRLWKVAVPFGLVNSGVYLVGAAQVPLLGAILGPTVIASVYLAFKISQTLNSFVLQIIGAQLPLFTKQCAQGYWSNAKRQMLQTLIIGGILQIGIAVFIYYISPKIVQWWVGKDHYIEGAVLLAFTINYLITTLAGLPAQFVLAAGRNPFSSSTIMHGIITIVGMLVLCPKLGLLGLPIAGLVGVLLTNFWINPLEGWRTWQSLHRPDFCKTN